MRKLSKILALALILIMALSVVPFTSISAVTLTGGETLYLDPGVWVADNARFAAYFCNGTSSAQWVSMTDSNSDGIYEVTVPTGKNHANVIFVRMNPAYSTNSWSYKWNQTNDLTYDGTKQLYSITAWGSDKSTGTWSVMACTEHNYDEYGKCTNTGCDGGHTYTIAGTGDHLGTEWDVSNTDNDMTYADGVYTKVYTNVAAGTYLFKCAQDHAWDVAYPSDNKSFTVSTAGSTVTITLKGTTVSVAVEAPHVCSFSDATCTAPATCSCGATQGEALGHDIVVDAAVDATCEGTGLTAGKHCSRCDDATVAQEVVDALGHDMVAGEVVAPTYEAQGYTVYTCANGCGTTENRDYVDALVMPITGSGTEEDPYLISTLEGLIFFRDSVNNGETTYNAEGVYVALGADIDMAEVDWSVNIGDNCNATFDGIFDGKGHKILNLNSTETAQSGDGYVCGGLFGAIYGNAVIKNLTLENVSIDTGAFTGNNVAAVVGFAYNASGSIENVTVCGKIEINASGIYGVGGIVGYSYYSNGLTVKDCKVIGDDGSYINAKSGVGGIVGYSNGDNLHACEVSGLSIEGTGLVGGIAGIALGTTNVADAALSNVALSATGELWGNSTGIAVGTIASKTLTVSDVTAENVTGASSMVGSAYVEKPTESVPAVEARIGDVYYVSFEDAYAVGGEIVLVSDVALDAPLTVTGTLVLDLNGKTLSYDSTVMGEAMITNKGNLTINDSVGTGVINYNYTGEIDSTYSKGNYTISNGGTLTVNGGYITIAKLRTHAKYPINNNSTSGDAILVINGGHLYNYNTSAIRMFCNSTTYKNSVTVNGGIVEGYCAIWMQHPGTTATVNGDLTITGGEIRTTAAAYVAGTAALKDVASRLYTTSEGGAWSESSFIAITGGIFNENIDLDENVPASLNVGEGATYNGYVELPHVHSYEAVVTAPTFDAQGYTTYTCSCGDSYVDSYVDALVAVALIGDVKYETVQKALDAALEGETVVLTQNISLTESLVLDGEAVNVILDLNGMTVTAGYDAEIVEVLLAKNGAKITVTGNGIMEATGEGEHVEVISAIDGAVVTIENGKFVSDGCTAIYATRGAIVNINGGYYEAHELYYNVNYLLDVNEGETVLGVINVSGGQFVDYDPADHNNDGTYTNKLVEGYHTTNNDGVYEVSAHEYTASVTAPTCTAVGYTTYTCSCGDSYTADEVAALDHTYVDGKCHCGAEDPEYHDHSYEAVVTVPTCTAVGYTTYTCSCGDNYTADEVAALGHNIVVDEAVAPTCTATGLTAGEHCTRCDYKVAQETVDALGHNIVVDEAVAPTCTATGLTAGEHCTRCDYKVAQETVDALGHNIVVDEAVAPTCTATGLTAGEHCTRCDHKVAQETVDALGHNIVVDAAVEATCTATGLTAGEHCTRCDYKVAQETVDALPHTEETVSGIDATCTTAGLTEGKKCSVCGAVIEAQEVVSALGHNIVVDAAVEATCTATGLTAGEHCTRCDYEIAQETVDALGHNIVVDAAVEATCTATGLTAGEHCTRCDHKVAQETVDALGHNIVVDEAVAPTCTATGLTAGEHCTRCDHKVAQETVDALGHNIVVDAAVEATCTATGLTAGEHCTRCDYKVAQETVDALGHNIVVDAAVEATCTATGLTAGEHCTRCDHKVAQETVDALGHNIVVDAAVEATCTATGLTAGEHCTRCDYEIAQETVDALPHTEETVNGIEATCTTAGLTEGKKCSVCGTVTAAQEGIPALGHNFAEGECTRCGASDPDHVDTHEHNFVEGKCECGEEDPNYVPPVEEPEMNFFEKIIAFIMELISKLLAIFKK